ncbi:NB-ARC domain-containing protein [Okeania sp.]|uniref:NB-ARC domain-containing protein n=1 Tax=Okeania sp. TaxID=3100323 RepID=UPI002B4B62C4|nr:NB-ARC domain-containing protein [Okeania sp.]MEB3341696.1 NB-ARC domain-containing protein [Okeania sp.]
MDFQELLTWADQQVLAHTGKPLDDLQKSILRGTWEREKYSDIANSYHCTEVHVKKVASRLWKTLSHSLDDGEQIKKSNLRAMFDRWRVSNLSVFSRHIGHIGNVSVCGNTSQPSALPKQEQTNSSPSPNNSKPHIDHSEAPDLEYCCDRSQELATLKNLLLEKRTRLIAISGMSGIGKTAIALELLSEIEDKFDYIIWRSFRSAPTLETTLKSLIQFFSNTPQNGKNQKQEEQLSLLIEYLRNNRCLIILDDLHQILEKEKLVGHYQSGYENYRNLFQTIAELSHKSCLIFNSWELPLEIVDLKNKNAPISCLKLENLGKTANKILEKEGLLDKEKWSELIHIYGGNPHWLKIAATGIKDLFEGRVGEYLQYKPLFLGEELTIILEQHLSRLSELEKQILLQISSQKEPVSISWFRENSERSDSDIFKAVRSLRKRSLLEKIEDQSSTLFAVKPIFQEYLLEQNFST